MRPASVIAALAAALVSTGTQAQHLAPFDGARPRAFVEGLTNTFPLAFGMSVDDAALALRAPLTYVQGRPGHEVFLAIRHIGGSGWFPRDDRLYLQFRNGRLTGWKADWGRDWIWQ